MRAGSAEAAGAARASHRLDAAIARVVSSGNCSGCGACTLLDPGLQMQLQANGFQRPVRERGDAGAAASGPGQSTAAGTRHDPVPDAAATFRAICPGVQVRAGQAAPQVARRHPTMGPVIQAFEAWATDPEVRFVGSSGGVLTALSAWLVESGEAAQVVGAGPDPADPRRTISRLATNLAGALVQTGSRYAPVSNAAHPAVRDPRSAVVGKPCEISALRALEGSASTASATAAPLLLSFFCAGTPSQHATESLVTRLGIPSGEPVAALRYRGHGWPGRFTVEPAEGTPASTSYEESWGTTLGPAVQWRCKVCADGVGESADLTAADLWRADARGYPDFEDRPGVSALLVRTPRGAAVVARAIAAGVIAVQPIDIDELASVQPLQRDRRQTLAGRLVGTVLAGGRIPRYRGFGLLALALPRWRATVRVARGTFRRRRLRRGNADA